MYKTKGGRKIYYIILYKCSNLIRELTQNLDKQKQTQISVAVYKAIHPCPSFPSSDLWLLSDTHSSAADSEEGQQPSTASRAETALPTNQCDGPSWDGGKEKVEEALRSLSVLTPV